MRVFALLLFAFLARAAPASAADDVAAAQDVIRSQEQAFSRNDAAAAYSYAAPAIRKLFPQAEIFLFMVQNSYAPVYRHKSFEFGEARSEGNWIAQRVHIVDADGEAWEAMYTLEQQADGSFKITGCSLLKAGEAV
jgi:parvulin-like peptidyl-prolyl isomerase